MRILITMSTNSLTVNIHCVLCIIPEEPRRKKTKEHKKLLGRGGQSTLTWFHTHMKYVCNTSRAEQ